MKKLTNLYLIAILILLQSPSKSMLFAESNKTQRDISDINPEDIANTIEGVAQIVETANNFIDQIIPDENNVGSNNQIINFISADELTKWEYINNYFTTNLNTLSTSQQIAKFVNDHAKYLAAPTIAIYMAATSNLLDQLKNLITPQTKATEPATITSKAVSTSIDLGSGSVKYIASPIVVCLVAYKVIKLISSMVEKKSETCLATLINFAQNWENHKAKTPDILYPLFEHLNQELINNNGKLPKIDALVAQKIVEAIISSSSIYTLM